MMLYEQEMVKVLVDGGKESILARFTSSFVSHRLATKESFPVESSRSWLSLRHITY